MTLGVTQGRILDKKCRVGEVVSYTLLIHTLFTGLRSSGYPQAKNVVTLCTYKKIASQ